MAAVGMAAGTAAVRGRGGRAGEALAGDSGDGQAAAWDLVAGTEGTAAAILAAAVVLAETGNWEGICRVWYRMVSVSGRTNPSNRTSAQYKLEHRIAG